MPLWSQWITLSFLLICSAFDNIRAPMSPIQLPLHNDDTHTTDNHYLLLILYTEYKTDRNRQTAIHSKTKTWKQVQYKEVTSPVAPKWAQAVNETGIGTACGTGQQPIICQSSVAGRCAVRGCALIRQLANNAHSFQQESDRVPVNNIKVGRKVTQHSSL